MKDEFGGEGLLGFFQRHEVVGEEDAPSPADLYEVMVEGEDGVGLFAAAHSYELTGIYISGESGKPSPISSTPLSL